METEEDKWYTRSTVYDNDARYKYNADLCNIIRKIQENISDLETYAIAKEMYDMEKIKIGNYSTF